MKLYILQIILQFLFINSYIKEDIRSGIFCDGKIHDSNNYLTTEEIYSLCSVISFDQRYLVFIKSGLISKIDAEFTKDTEMTFNSYCKDYPSFCSNGFLIFLYVNDKKVRIHAGSLVRTQISISDREYIIEYMKPYLQRRQYGIAIEKSINEIRKSVKYIPPTTNIPPPTNNNRPQQSSGISTFFLLIMILCPICLCICCIVAMMRNRQEKADHTVYEHTNLLMNLLNEVKVSCTRNKIIGFCLVCTRSFPSFNPDFPSMQNNFQCSDDVVRFQCGHLYHNSCLLNHGINQCLMCGNHPSALTRVPNFAEYRQEVSEVQLVNFMQKLNQIYSKQQIEEYYQSYPDHRCQVESNFGITMVACFGITALATGAILASTMDHHHYDNYNHYGNYHDNNYNNNYDNNNYYQGNQNAYSRDGDGGDTAGGNWD